jgi:CRP/FNR family cyclic AMP-dependent transcriptional regulator
MELKEIIRGFDLFEGLTSSELDEIVAICQRRRFKKGDVLTVEGDIGEDLFIVMDGTVEILIKRDKKSPKIVIHLGVGQLIGEMSLVDRGPRSATVRAIQDPTIVQVIRHQDFHNLCKHNHRIGYIVMHNIAADMSFKLRHRHLSET